MSETLERIPARLRQFAAGAVAAAVGDDRLLAVIVGGSVASGTADEYSDLDLVLVSTADAHRHLLAEAMDFAGRLGPLLVAFTGEHVGEPRLLITLYGPPATHVDLKFVSVDDLDTRVENGLVLWQRDDRIRDALARTTPAWPSADAQWIEDRFWVWIHYVAAKVGRGELFEAVDALGTIRGAALAPLLTAGRTDKPSGTRRVEQLAPEHMGALAATVARPDRADCLRAVQATVDLYQQLRADLDLERRTEAEAAVLAYVRDVS